MGVGSFGPIGIDPQQETYGKILATPKKGWQQFDFLGTLKNGIPPLVLPGRQMSMLRLLGNWKQGAAQGMRSCVYLTIGTGIGAGIVITRKSSRRRSSGSWAYFCETASAGRLCRHLSLSQRLSGRVSSWSLTGSTDRYQGQHLPKDHEIWDLQAFYIGQALVNITLTVAPDRIVLGGGVMNQPHLLTKIHDQFTEQMAGYMETPTVTEYIVAWGLPNKSGIIGSLLLGKEAQ